MAPELTAILAAVLYSLSFVAARRGLRYSNSATVTVVSLVVQSVTFCALVGVTGAPALDRAALGLIVVAGSFQPFVRQMTYLGMQKIGAARSGSLRATHPFWAGLIAVALLGETLTLRLFLGNATVIAGIAAISWQGSRVRLEVPGWYVLFPMTAAFLAGVAFPLRRAALTLSPEPLFFAAVIGVVGLSLVGVAQAVPALAQQYVWDRRALRAFLAAGLFEAVANAGILYALRDGDVVVIAPITATLPMWTLLGTVVFLRDMERVTRSTVLGTVLVVVGIILVTTGG